MSTHAALGVRMSDSTIVGCYIHYDGDKIEERLRGFLKEKTTTDLAMLVLEAQSRGGMRCFYSPKFNSASLKFEGAPRTEFLDDDKPYVINEDSFYSDHMGTYAWYLVDYTTNKIEITDSYYSRRIV